MKNVFTLLIAIAACTYAGAQTVTSYDLNPGAGGFTVVPQSAEWDPVANEPLFKFQGSPYYIEALYSELEAYRNGTVSNADFFKNHALKLNSSTTGQPLQLFRTLLNFSDTKGLLITQANTTVSKCYLYETTGKGLLANTPLAQRTLDDLDLVDSVGPVRGYVKFKDKIVVSAGTPTYGIGLMVVDSNYNMMVIDINTAASADATPQGLFNWGDSVIIFQANNGTDGIELWRSNGTLAGTTMIKDINTSGDSEPQKFIAYNGKVYFVANDGTGTELWATDGTTAGTVKVADLNATADADPNNLTIGPAGLLYFAVSDNNGRFLYKTDGTQAGTTIITNTVSPSGFSHPFQTLRGNLYFIGTQAGVAQAPALYKTDGTAAGTSLWFQPYSGPATTYYGVSNSFAMTTSGGYVYFIGNDSVQDFEIYATNGVGTPTQVTNFAQASSGSNYPNYLTPIPNGGIFCFGKDSIIGTELRIINIGLSEVGIKSLETTLATTVYPNPTTNNLTIETQTDGIYSVSLFDITGRLVATESMESVNGNILYNRPLQASSQGVYFLRLSNQAGQQTIKVVYQ